MHRRSKKGGVDQRKIIYTSRREMLRPNVLETGEEMPTTRASGDFPGGASHTGNRNANRTEVFENGGRKPSRRLPRDSRQNESRHHSPCDDLHPRGSGGLSRRYYGSNSLHEPGAAPTQRNSSLPVAKSRHHAPYDDLHPRGPGGLPRSYDSCNDLHEPGTTASRYRNPRGSLHAECPSDSLHSRGKCQPQRRQKVVCPKRTRVKQSIAAPATIANPGTEDVPTQCGNHERGTPNATQRGIRDVSGTIPPLTASKRRVVATRDGEPLEQRSRQSLTCIESSSAVSIKCHSAILAPKNSEQRDNIITSSRIIGSVRKRSSHKPASRRSIACRENYKTFVNSARKSVAFVHSATNRCEKKRSRVKVSIDGQVPGASKVRGAMSDRYREREKELLQKRMQEYIASDLDDAKYMALKTAMQAERRKRLGRESKRRPGCEASEGDPQGGSTTTEQEAQQGDTEGERPHEQPRGAVADANTNIAERAILDALAPSASGDIQNNMARQADGAAGTRSPKQRHAPLKGQADLQQRVITDLEYNEFTLTPEMQQWTTRILAGSAPDAMGCETDATTYGLNPRYIHLFNSPAPTTNDDDSGDSGRGTPEELRIGMNGIQLQAIQIMIDENSTAPDSAIISTAAHLREAYQQLFDELAETTYTDL
ncbi:hypothetical protein QAD02_008713 [Eretmocerus hayati]|uniref:Uncharacterized protein n=1 Tax=Eretmocerus hayati TaxID=131215 RepID=A0ACC2N832_9HYME|nr:hypothetical protein QAD02_008713 [Eretmocerus hayati]